MSLCFLSPNSHSDSLHMPTLIGCYLLKIILYFRATLVARSSFCNIREARLWSILFSSSSLFLFIFKCFSTLKNQTHSHFPTKLRSAKKCNYEHFYNLCQHLLSTKSDFLFKQQTNLFKINELGFDFYFLSIQHLYWLDIHIAPTQSRGRDRFCVAALFHCVPPRY